MYFEELEKDTETGSAIFAIPTYRHNLPFNVRTTSQTLTFVKQNLSHPYYEASAVVVEPQITNNSSFANANFNKIELERQSFLKGFYKTNAFKDYPRRVSP